MNIEMKKIPIYIILCIYLIIVLFPMVWLLYSSFKTTQEIYANTWNLPRVFHLDNFVRAWTNSHVGQYFFNSVTVTSISLVLSILIASMAAYILARFEFKGNRLILYIFLSGMMIPVQLALVPLVFLAESLGIRNLIGLCLVYVAFSLPFSIFVLTGFFKTLPSELSDAASIDGCSEFGVFWRIMLPLAKPGLVTVAIFNFLGFWNEYLFALLFLSNEKQYTVPLGLANLMMVMEYKADWGALFAGLVIVMIPTLIVYICLQDRLTKGITAGALKG